MEKKKIYKELFFWAKRVHVWTMWLAIGLGGVMTVTGLALEDIDEGGGLLSLVVDPLLIRVVHRSLASPFALVLGLMIGTGFLMWVLPKLMRRG